jgi:hypothetical protein
VRVDGFEERARVRRPSDAERVDPGERRVEDRERARHTVFATGDEDVPGTCSDDLEAIGVDAQP